MYVGVMLSVKCLCTKVPCTRLEQANRTERLLDGRCLTQPHARRSTHKSACQKPHHKRLPFDPQEWDKWDTTAANSRGGPTQQFHEERPCTSVQSRIQAEQEAKRARVDGVEIHAHHPLLGQLLLLSKTRPLTREVVVGSNWLEW